MLPNQKGIGRPATITAEQLQRGYDYRVEGNCWSSIHAELSVLTVSGLARAVRNYATKHNLPL